MHGTLKRVIVASLVALSPAVAAAGQPAAPLAAPPAADLLINGLQPRPDILTGGQPTVEQLAAIREAGYVAVINLRPEAEEGSLAASTYESLGFDYVHLPIVGGDDLDEEHTRAFAAALAAARRPLVVHCASGNRVGALFALQAHWLDGLAAEDALEVGRAAGLTRLEPTVRERLGLPSATPE